jgi:hypothetical protein
MGVGAEYSVRESGIGLMFTAQSPVRRGGFLMRGSVLRFDASLSGRESFTLGLLMPIGNPLAGRGRPLRDYVIVAGQSHPRVRFAISDPELIAALDSVRASAEWIRRIVVPFLDQDGRDAGIAERRTESYVQELNEHLVMRSADEEVRYFHTQLEQAFVFAARDSARGLELAGSAREILLDAMILPYNSLLGRKKRQDTLDELGAVARARFVRLVMSVREISDERTDAVLFVFQTLTEMLDEVRERAASEWDDNRLVWLPLQYSLLPEDHDDQAELDALIERATGIRFSDNNRVTYVANMQFHLELLRTIRDTRDYHVLWIHDFPAVAADGTLDPASTEQVVDGYLSTLAERVEAYDRTGRLPSYFIFLDQHYYEQRKSRILMNVLEDPLAASPPEGLRGDTTRMERALDRLRTAVRNSRLLQAETRQFGKSWLRNRIKVHVSITNRPDASFWSGGLVSSVFGYPDNVMRDHRKIAFRDVDESDPMAGVGIFTGMGVGQHYLGPSWDDRSLIMQGPALLELKRAARDLLRSQGVPDEAVPFALRSTSESLNPPRPSPDAFYDERAITLVDGTGYLPKPLNVAKAILYSLATPGSVIKIPDSLWNSSFYAGLLVGACLRGATVSVVAPARANAPSSGFVQMSRAHELFMRLLIVRQVLADPIHSAGGRLRTGLYALDADRDGFASRRDAWVRQVRALASVREIMPFRNDMTEVVAECVLPAASQRLEADPGAAEPPKLHQKIQFFASGALWDAIATSPEWPLFMSTYLQYRAATHNVRADSAAVMQFPAELERIAQRIFDATRGVTEIVSYAMVGSQNQDYRGMFMDGEVAVLFTGPESLVPLIDLAFLEGTVTWIDDEQTLDRLIPPVGEMLRRLARAAKDAV